MRVGIDSTHSTGKSELLKALQEIEGLKNYVFIEEAARRIIEEIGKPPQDMTPEELKDFQIKILNTQQEAELEAGENYISDRTVFGCLAYSDSLGQPMCDRLAAAAKHRYNVIFEGTIEQPMQNDGVRLVDEQYRKKIQDRIHGYLAYYPDNVIQITGTLEEKVATILSYLKI